MLANTKTRKDFKKSMKYESKMKARSNHKNHKVACNQRKQKARKEPARIETTKTVNKASNPMQLQGK